MSNKIDAWFYVVLCVLLSLENVEDKKINILKTVIKVRRDFSI